MKSAQFAEQLTYQRKLRGLSQEQLAEKTKVTVRTIQRIEKGAVTPHLRTVKLLAAALEIEVDDLLQLDDPREENIQTKWLLLMHASPFIGVVLPFLNILCPLFVWVHKREDSPIYDSQGRAVINFQITMTLLYVLAFIFLLTIKGFGFLFFIAVVPLNAVIMLANIIAVMRHRKCYYPAIPFLGMKHG
ncbi:MAG: helix-turn-helix domain-containing protein [Pseudomonadota bacterium]|nr:helix-turn-helix domain-containing protein [Pseudomonadota bacterium]